MRRLIYITVSFLLSLLVVSCDKDIDKFDNSTNYIYFGVPFVKDQFGRDTKTRVDSMAHSFALEDVNISTYTFKIPVNTIGLPASEDRSYTVKVVNEATNATAEDWDASTIAGRKIEKGTLSDTIALTVNKSDILSKEWRHIVLKLEANENFQLGPDTLRSIKVAFTNIITEPDWWKNWKGYFGEFNREVYTKWIEIYYLGADPNTDDNGNQYYWDNMPEYAYWAESTKIFVQILKVYFLEHEVYPDGDTTKPRILLP